MKPITHQLLNQPKLVRATRKKVALHLKAYINITTRIVSKVVPLIKYI